MHQLGGVLLQVHAVDPNFLQPPVARERDVVLGDLVALGQVGIEVVLAVEDGARRDVAVERQRDHQTEVHGLRVRDRERARVAQADRAGVRVGRVAEGQRATAEHLRARGELHVDLQPDHGLVLTLRHRLRHERRSRRSRWPARARRPRRGCGSR